jgi:hypothetical protein
LCDADRELAAVLQVEFPTLGLANCPGDSEGVNEMNESAALLRQLCAVFERAGTAEGVRIFFPGACRGSSLPAESDST